MALVPATSQVCTPGASVNWVCFDSGGRKYTRVPQPNYDNNNVRAGFGVSTARATLGYERRLNPSLSLALRIGIAAGGSPTPQGGSAFVPLHLEGRATYAWGNGRRQGPSLVPFIFASAGIAEVDTAVTVLVVEAPCSSRYAPSCSRWLTAWQRGGYGFAASGLGLRWDLGEHIALVADLRFSAMFVAWTLVVTPELGAALAF